MRFTVHQVYYAYVITFRYNELKIDVHYTVHIHQSLMLVSGMIQ